MTSGAIGYARTGEKTRFKIVMEYPFIDSHMHIQSSHCCPLPLIWQNSAIIDKKNRQQMLDSAETADIFVNLATVKVALMSDQSTFDIAKGAIRQLSVVTLNDRQFGKINMGTMIVMPMDMEYAHFSGFEGLRIYRKQRDGTYQYLRRRWITKRDLDALVAYEKSPVLYQSIDPVGWQRLQQIKQSRLDTSVSKFHFKSGGTLYESVDWKTIPGETVKTYHVWKRQRLETEKAAVSYPFQMIPMVHFEPRRYTDAAIEQLKAENETDIETREQQFAKLATKNQPGAYIGFKMYCNMGYQPADPHIDFLRDFSFYRRCAQEQIPILVHNSPAGLFTHEREFYFYHLDPKSKGYKETGEQQWLDFYQQTYAHPKNWKPVLDNVKDLKLCLAHFGGDIWDKHKAWHVWGDDKEWEKDWVDTMIELVENHEHVYIDISYYILHKYREKFTAELLKHPKLRERILFGTDWYMTELDEMDYNRFCSMIRSQLVDVDFQINRLEGKTDKDADRSRLWQQFTIINPMRFYGLHDEVLLRNSKNGLINKLTELTVNDDQIDSQQDKRKSNIEENYKKMLAGARSYQILLKQMSKS